MYTKHVPLALALAHTAAAVFVHVLPVAATCTHDSASHPTQQQLQKASVPPDGRETTACPLSTHRLRPTRDRLRRRRVIGSAVLPIPFAERPKAYATPNETEGHREPFVSLIRAPSGLWLCVCAVVCV